MELKRNIFYIFEITRFLFNEFYNGHSDNFTDEELNKIFIKMMELKEKTEELHQSYYEETFKNGDLPF